MNHAKNPTLSSVLPWGSPIAFLSVVVTATRQKKRPAAGQLPVRQHRQPDIRCLRRNSRRQLARNRQGKRGHPHQHQQPPRPRIPLQQPGQPHRKDHQAPQWGRAGTTGEVDLHPLCALPTGRCDRYIQPEI